MLYRLSLREIAAIEELYCEVSQLWPNGTQIDIDSEAGVAANYLQSWIDGVISSDGVVSGGSLIDIEKLANDSRNIPQVGDIVDRVWRVAKEALPR